MEDPGQIWLDLVTPDQIRPNASSARAPETSAREPTRGPRGRLELWSDLAPDGARSELEPAGCSDHCDLPS